MQEGGVGMNEGLQQAGEGGEREQAGNHAGAVDGETLEPLAKVVAVGAEDEELVAEVGDRDVERRGDDGSEDDGEVEEALRQRG